MLERQLSKNKKNLNLQEDQMSSQIKRVQELLKVGDIPWARVKSAYCMCEQALSQACIQLIETYPLKYYMKLCKLVFFQFFQYFGDDDRIDQTRNIKTKIFQQNKYILSKLGDRPPNLSSNGIDTSEGIYNRSAQILEKGKNNKENLVQIQLKKVLESFDNAKVSILEELQKQSDKKTHSSQNIKLQISDVFGSWKKSVAQKYQELNKWIQQTRNMHEQALKKKNEQIWKLKIQLEKEGVSKSSCCTQTINFQKIAESKLKEKEMQFSIEKQRFVRITMAHQRQIMQLKTHNNSLRTSSHLKIQQFEKNIVDLTSSINHLKGQFKVYLQQNKKVHQNFFNIYQKHQKTKTPFIPKLQVAQVYQKMKRNALRVNSISNLLQQDCDLIYKKQTSKQDFESKSKRCSKSKDLLVDVPDSIPKINSFYVPKKIRISAKINQNKYPSRNNIQDSLPSINITEIKDYSPLHNKGQVKSLYLQQKSDLRQNQNTLTIPTNDDYIIPRKQSRSNIHYNNIRDSTNSLHSRVQKENKRKSPSKIIQNRESLRPIIRQLSKQNICSSQNIQASQKQIIQKSEKEILGHSKSKILRTESSKKCISEKNDQNQESDSNQQAEKEYHLDYNIKISVPDDDFKQNSKNRTSIEVKDSKIKQFLSPLVKNQMISLSKSTVIQKDRSLKQSKQNKSLYIKRQLKKNTNMQNFQKEVSNFLQKYSQKLNDNMEMTAQILQCIQKVKNYHSMACSKKVCWHLKKFYERLSKLNYEQSKKKLLKVAQLNIKHIM